MVELLYSYFPPVFNLAIYSFAITLLNPFEEVLSLKASMVDSAIADLNLASCHLTFFQRTSMVEDFIYLLVSSLEENRLLC
jgi:hypothetical protein